MKVIRTEEEIIRRLNVAVMSSQWNQRELGKRAGLAEDKLSKVLHGTRRLTPFELARLSEALEIPIGEFLYEEEA